MARCRSCGAGVLWAVTELGRRIPLDDQPTADGNVVVTDHADDGTPVVRVLTASDGVPSSPRRYLSHFVTCPQAKHWRRDPP